jgi:hypothetical protein
MNSSLEDIMTFVPGYMHVAVTFTVGLSMRAGFLREQKTKITKSSWTTHKPYTDQNELHNQSWHRHRDR